MPDPKNPPAGSEPPPNVITYKNPRRTSPENSITLRHHRLAREASKRPSAANDSTALNFSLSPRRNSSGESIQTGLSDPKRWFDRQNENSRGNIDTAAMDVDVDPPFYQKETDSSNEEGKYPIPSQSPAYRFVQSRAPGLRPGMTHSSSADDYRSVIDDLTIENKRLREELKRYRQIGPDSLRRDKLFEVKVHGLPSRKKRELEAALRDFTTSLDGSSTGASPRKRLGKVKNMKLPSEGVSKHASSSSGSRSRPVDSAYASMSTGAGSSDPTLPMQAKISRHRSDQNVENYLRDIPEGLWPRPTVMTEKERKKVVVRRLEHLFTGKMAEQSEQLVRHVPPPIAEDVEMESATNTSEGKESVAPAEPSREAKIRPSKSKRKESSRDTGSASNEHSNEHSNGDQTDSRDNGNGSGSGSGHDGTNTSPHDVLPPEQRPTRPRDLDPDRKQIPSENMDYIRHLGLVAPESQKRYSAKDVSPDADGWVYLNLLCNLAQLHILNVTSDFIRSAVSEKSTKFQLSPDGRKIRWRGGADGTKFSSDSSGSNSQKGQSSDDNTDGSNDQDQRKKQKTQNSGNDVISHIPSSFKPQNQNSTSSESFHYKPLFVHHQTSSSDDQPSLGNETGSSLEESNLGGMNSRWGQSGAASERKRRRDGAIIYYSGAPFCTDLSGDCGEVSPDTYDMTSSGGNQYPAPSRLDRARPEISRSTSGSLIPFRPLSGPASYGASMDLDDPSTPPTLTSGESNETDDIEANFEWSDQKQAATLLNLEASGLGGIYPEDHFVVVVSTKRGRKHALSDSSESSDEDDEDDSMSRRRALERPSQDTTDSRTTTDSVAGKLASLTTTSPMPFYVSSVNGSTIKIDYLTGKVRRLPPVPLPPPAFYYPSMESDSDEFSETDETEALVSRRVVLADGAISDDDDLSGNDEEDEHSEGVNYDASGSISPDNKDDIGITSIERGRSGRISRLSKLTTGSSVATAGGAASGAASGYNSSMEE